MKIRLFLDEDVHATLAHALSQRGFNAVHAQGLERTGLADDEIETIMGSLYPNSFLST